jgi:hypothetical protein
LKEASHLLQAVNLNIFSDKMLKIYTFLPFRKIHLSEFDIFCLIKSLVPLTGFFKLTGFHSCITEETLLLSLSIDGDNTFSETLVRAIVTWYRVPEDVFNHLKVFKSFSFDITSECVVIMSDTLNS